MATYLRLPLSDQRDTFFPGGAIRSSLSRKSVNAREEDNNRQPNTPCKKSPSEDSIHMMLIVLTSHPLAACSVLTLQTPDALMAKGKARERGCDAWSRAQALPWYSPLCKDRVCGAVIMDSPEPKESVDETETGLGSNGDAHSSLKHQLLGPSLTKAGQDAVDQRKVSCPTSFDSIIAIRKREELKASRFRKLFTTHPRAPNSLTMKRPGIVV